MCKHASSQLPVQMIIRDGAKGITIIITGPLAESLLIVNNHHNFFYKYYTEIKVT